MTACANPGAVAGIDPAEPMTPPGPGRWLAVVGLGEDGLDGVTPLARRLIATATVLFGGERHLALLPPDHRPRHLWQVPLGNTLRAIAAMRGQPVCVLATGDPLCYGIGTTLTRVVPAAEMVIVPSVSAFSLACARLGWPLTDVETLSLHGRPLAALESFVQPGARLVILSADGGTPAKVAGLLRNRGYGPSLMTVFEHMGGPREHHREGIAAAWGPEARAADFNTLAVECRAEPGTPALARVPGLPDQAFAHDGQLTKREVRAATLAALAPVPGQQLWDVGAGCGSVALEWLRSHPRCRAVAIERHPARLRLIAANAETLGCPQLWIVAGSAPSALEGLPPPDAVFLGGGLSEPGLVARCWEALPRGGRLVANAVTLNGEQSLLAWQAQAGGSLTRLQVVRAEPVGPHLAWRPLMPVTQYVGVKP